MRLLLYYVAYWGTSIIVYYGENEPLVQLLAWSRCDIYIIFLHYYIYGFASKNFANER